MEYKTLYNGVKMPMLGYGVFQITNDQTEKCVSIALEEGYRLFDTAQAYMNEEGVGRAIAKSNVDRSEIFITTKIWISNGGYEKAKLSIQTSLEKLGTDYIDLLLIHQPFNDYYGTYRAMEEAYKAGKVKAIGVSNFTPDRLVDLCKFVEIKPMVNQVEMHVFNQQRTARKVMDKYSVQTEAWGPFAEAKNDIFNNSTLIAIAERYGKTTAQIALRYLIECGVIAIPKSINRSRIAENFAIFDFELDQVDMAAIKSLDENITLFASKHDYEHVEEITSFKI